MRFITYNIQDGGDGRIDDIVNVLKRYAPDLIAINEANDFDKNDSQRLEEFSKKVGLQHCHLALSTQSGYHVAILSRYPFKAIKELHSLKRAGVVAVIETDMGDISIAAVHLAPSTEDTRLNELSAAISEQAKYDLRIIMGDLNSLSENDGYDFAKLSESADTPKQEAEVEEPRYDVINKLEQSGYFDVAAMHGNQKEYTVPITQDGNSVYRNLRLDYIFVSERLRSRLSSYAVIRSKLAEKTSDHFPVVAEFKV